VEVGNNVVVIIVKSPKHFKVFGAFFVDWFAKRLAFLGAEISIFITTLVPVVHYIFLYGKEKLPYKKDAISIGARREV
jgi:hypothetical protein